MGWQIRVYVTKNTTSNYSLEKRKRARTTQEPVSFLQKMPHYYSKGKGATVYLSSCQTEVTEDAVEPVIL